MSYTSWFQDPEGIAKLASRQFLKLLFSSAPHTTTPQTSLLLKRRVTDILPRYPDQILKSGKEDAKRTKDKDRDLYQVTEKLIQILEQEIRSNPPMWFWVHDRWKDGWERFGKH